MTDKCLPDLEAWKRQQYVEMEAEHRLVSAKLDYDAARLIAWEEARPSQVSLSADIAGQAIVSISAQS